MLKLNLDLLPSIKLSKGAHESPQNGVCVQEALHLMAGIEHGDSLLPCQSPEWPLVKLNDGPWKSDEERTAVLMPRAIRTLGTAGDGKMQARVFAAADYAVRVICGEMAYDGKRLADLPKIVDVKTAGAAYSAADSAACSAAYSAADSAACSAAHSAADAAHSAADAAYSAAYSAACSAVYSAAYAQYVAGLLDAMLSV